MLKVLTACGNGMGSSMVIKMKVENALRQLGVTDIQSASCSVAEAKSQASGYDIVVASNHLIKELEGRTDGKLVGLDNLMDDNEIKTKLQAIL
ncbi:PTS sugar transporter subunit IIB [Tuanshanicoccus lijuaniae]|uniref:PTS sugar transporter subunit IIB n=1 Tax=Aerococcaceae bacterium zg-1292 TaxID=2774330 RepID=UPI0019388BC4|nr:PTS sugar transporter subunit IIB [Aerococcaceae bacterium zg-1292]MBF6625546.1 PTS sugar transporter subunit IIB [Aerococcaceae bacterium zg-BR9]MBF6977733.1 PTS sugar transporter subunit IIB [Aerococcaceae bacterium zg-BR22]MBS4456505.1 PTS sugar transporter subunit IIB [Aerococcaceae bacterium zg-A91]MBS4458606.1 PTS sugar transporter subunit IIB [Aerococcaceae bacterium zg-BR33]